MEPVRKALLIDVADLSECCTEHSLEFMYKSMADPPDNDELWKPHPDPLIRDAVEEFYGNGEVILQRIMNALLTRIRGIDTVAKAFRPDPIQVHQAIARLQGKSPRDYTINDWLTLVDWLVVHYLPADAIKSRGEYLAVRAAIAGKIKTVSDQYKPGPYFSTLMPTTIAQATSHLGLTELETTMLDLAAARAGEAITFIGESTRHRIKQLLVNHLQARAQRDPGATAKRLERQLFDEFSYLNRDWRRVAITEAGNVQNEALVAASPLGTKLKRFEAYAGACPFCRKINGMVFTVVSPSKEPKDPWKEVWVGKTNYGRSASPRKRVGDELIERTDAELWWPAAGLQHPNCRGGWIVWERAQPPNPKVSTFVDQLLAKHGLTGTPLTAS